jgi:phage-related protein
MSATNYFDTGNFSPYANYIEKSFFPTWHNRSVAGPFSIIPNQYSYKIETKLTDARYGNFYTNQQKNEPNEYVSGKYYLTSFFVKPLYSHSEGGATYSLIGIRDSQDIYDFVLAFDLRNKTFSHRLYNNFMPPFETGAAYKEYQDGWIRVLFSIEYNGKAASYYFERKFIYTSTGSYSTVGRSVLEIADPEFLETNYLLEDPLEDIYKSYKISPRSSSVNEASSLTFDINKFGFPIDAPPETVYWQITGSSVNSADFVNTTGSLIVSSGSGSFSVSTIADATEEGVESFYINLRTGSITGPIVATSSTVFINDTSSSVIYSINPIQTLANEGSQIIFNVSSTGFSNGTLYWRATGENITQDDFVNLTGSASMINSTGSFSVDIKKDLQTEGPEAFYIKLFSGSVDGSLVATSPYIGINDTSLSVLQNTFSDDNLFYDRSSNIGVDQTIQSLTYKPVYGSKVSFSSKANVYETQNGYFHMIPLSPNSLDAKFELRFDLNESDSQYLVNYIENQRGHFLFPFTDASNFYKTVSGVSDNYAINHINKQHYEVAMSFEVNQAPTLLNWSGMTFINTGLQYWSAGANYKKYDIVYSGVNQFKLNNYYYCTEDHTSSNPALDGPTGFTSKWSQQFFFEPDIGLQNDVQLKVDKIEFSNSFVQRMQTRKNIAPINLNYKFTNIDTRQAKSIMHFLENKAGYRRFYHQIPSVYNRPKIFYCPSWTHTFNYENSHTIEVNFVEDPLGILPTGS